MPIPTVSDVIERARTAAANHAKAVAAAKAVGAEIAQEQANVPQK